MAWNLLEQILVLMEYDDNRIFLVVVLLVIGIHP